MLYNHYVFFARNDSVKKEIEYALMLYGFINKNRFNTNFDLQCTSLGARGPKGIYNQYLIKSAVKPCFTNNIFYYKYYNASFPMDSLFHSDYFISTSTSNINHTLANDNLEILWENIVSILYGRKAKKELDSEIMYIVSICSEEPAEEHISLSLHKNILTCKINEKYRNVNLNFIQ